MTKIRRGMIELIYIVRSIKEKMPKMDISPIFKVFDHLKEKIHKADNFGLTSLRKVPNM